MECPRPETVMRTGEAGVTSAVGRVGDGGAWLLVSLESAPHPESHKMLTRIMDQLYILAKRSRLIPILPYPLTEFSRPKNTVVSRKFPWPITNYRPALYMRTRC